MSRPVHYNGVMDDPHLAWAAGLFIGEGTICVHRSQNRKNGPIYQTVRIHLKMTDERSVERFASILDPYVPARERHIAKTGMNRESREYKSGAAKVVRPYWGASIGGKPCVEICRVLWPYISDTQKGDQVAAALEQIGVDTNAW